MRYSSLVAKGEISFPSGWGSRKELFTPPRQLSKRNLHFTLKRHNARGSHLPPHGDRWESHMNWRGEQHNRRENDEVSFLRQARCCLFWNSSVSLLFCGLVWWQTISNTHSWHPWDLVEIILYVLHVFNFFLNTFWMPLLFGGIFFFICSVIVRWENVNSKTICLSLRCVLLHVFPQKKISTIISSGPFKVAFSVFPLFITDVRNEIALLLLYISVFIWLS